MTSLLWFRRDLRLDDHPALLHAAESGDVLGVFVADDTLLHVSGAPRRHFLAGCVQALSESMHGRLLVTHGRPDHVIPQLAADIGADAVHVSADYGPYGRARDERVAKALQAKGIDLVATGSPYAVAPGRVRKPDGTPYAVFTPFHRAWSAHGWRRPAGPGTDVRWVDPAGFGHPFDPAELSARIPSGMKLPTAGETAARTVWAQFLDRGIDAYDDERNRPDHPGTSHMSAYLKWGCIHPRTLMADLAVHRSAGAASYQRELAFREFYADILFHHPETLTTSADPIIDRLTWDSGPEAESRLAAWKAGRTGYPYIDAGLRQLLAEGWIHNRVRMGVASFLIKDLHVAWPLGAAHFLDHLVDGDIASNTHGWQWVAGAGAQAAPYYRVFNPVTQGEKFDPAGHYVRAYVPELAGVPGRAVHQPWNLPGGIPAGYVEPIVDHAAERAETLRRWEQRPR
ncbi:deoxyribodipyrimidine photo-lyase [Nakamurella panacisegetis]|uniref:Deoxyribodipyrimidine photo-lyase n=1 Tax=Nakamurella panacisegetis TaxID=1090615 RepID=A0A1H0J1G4_9ACTN|nr:deoxyribodipyrimidine photo-lyase [Nakamurella panacisegetis]SDO37587.1 deoxyribodipyrimidine photo-lyase [Nakamurella panacisegetis]